MKVYTDADNAQFCAMMAAVLVRVESKKLVLMMDEKKNLTGSAGGIKVRLLRDTKGAYGFQIWTPEGTTYVACYDSVLKKAWESIYGAAMVQQVELAKRFVVVLEELDR